jgi:pimeloyl-ACP methyl ester carboxylesterase
MVLEEIAKTDPLVRDYIGKSIMECDFAYDEIIIIKQLNIPIAVLHGNDDNMVNLDYVRKINFNKLWEGEIKIIPDAGHCPQLENPKEFNILLHRFLQFSSKL